MLAHDGRSIRLGRDASACVREHLTRSHFRPTNTRPGPRPRSKARASLARISYYATHAMAGHLPRPSPHFQLPLRASFYRGGTSRGLIVNSSRLAPYDQASRDAILCAAMGSPDPDGRQIDGLGGGASSLSKVAVVNAPGRSNASLARKAGNGFPGVDWAEDIASASRPDGWDVVYRFGQVPIKKGSTIDWGSTCGNLISAVAQHTILSGFLNKTSLDQRARQAGIDPNDPLANFMLPLRILTANNGQRITARVPVMRRDRGWSLPQAGECKISGVPGSASPVVVETPLETSHLLPTGNARDVITIKGKEIPITIVDAGLPVIFVESQALDVDFEHLISHPASLDADAALMRRIEEVRQTASSLTTYLRDLYFPGSASPKVCLLHPRARYMTTGGEFVMAEDYHCLIRAVSVGQFHRTVPATTLSAIGVASAMPDSLVSEVIAKGQGRTAQVNTGIPPWIEASAGNSKQSQSAATVSSVSVGQPAGVSSTCFRTPAKSQMPEAILMDRTARLLMDGDVWFPASAARIFEPYVDAVKRSATSPPPVFAPSKRFSGIAGDPWYHAINDAASVQPRGERAFLNGNNESSKPRGRPPARKEKSAASSLTKTSRKFSTSARSSATSAVRAPQPVHLYRHLTRAVQRHNALKHPHRSSLQLILRDDFRAGLASVQTAADPAHAMSQLTSRVEKTILLLLSASFLNDVEKPLRHSVRAIDDTTVPRARTLLANLGSLTYHNLSPNTVMSPKRAPRLAGGSETGAARAARSRMNLSPTVDSRASMMVLNDGNVASEFGEDGAAAAGGVAGSQRPLVSLATIARPRRGPATAQPNVMWDGQRPDKLLKLAQSKATSAQRIAQLTETVASLHAQVIEERQRQKEGEINVGDGVGGSSSNSSSSAPTPLPTSRKKKDNKSAPAASPSPSLLEQYKSVRGVLKSLRAAEKKEAEQAQAQRELKSRLTELVQGAEESSSAFCGGARWTQWQEGKWLAP